MAAQVAVPVIIMDQLVLFYNLLYPLLCNGRFTCPPPL